MQKTKTRHNIYYDLSKSPFTVFSNGQAFTFSSELYAQKFRDRKGENRYRMEAYLFKLYGIVFDCSVIADIVLYAKIEKRGFDIKDEKGNPICPKNLKSVGVKPILKN